MQEIDLNLKIQNAPEIAKNAPDIHFEGPEKKLIIQFVDSGSNISGEAFSSKLKFRDDYKEIKNGFRQFNSKDWQKILKYAQCNILSIKSNNYFDAYLLSESSLFVYSNKIIIKTCGTTTLLYIINPILELAKSINMKPQYVMYTHKNFIFPKNQIYPHRDFQEEVEYLNRYFDGKQYILGNKLNNHFYLYFYNNLGMKIHLNNLEIMMQNLNLEKMKQFYKISSSDPINLTKISGISGILSNMDIDSYLFTPCGYSMNGLFEEYYSTIHVTPEKGYNYSSYETNYNMCNIDEYSNIIEKVRNVFDPRELVIVIYCDDNHIEYIKNLVNFINFNDKEKEQIILKLDNNLNLFFLNTI